MKTVGEAVEKVVAALAPAAKRKPKKRGVKRAAPFLLEESWPEMREETRLLSKIYPYPNNPRTHPPSQLALLAELIKKHGPDQRIVIDEEGVILKGHGRHSAALIAGLREFPVLIRFGLSEAEKIAIRISDNQVSVLSGWHPDLIRGEIGLLKQSGYELSLLGFGETQLVQFMTIPGPPGTNQQFGDDGDIEYCCPKCSHKWAGNPLAGLAKKKSKKTANPKKAK